MLIFTTTTIIQLASKILRFDLAIMLLGIYLAESCKISVKGGIFIVYFFYNNTKSAIAIMIPPNKNTLKLSVLQKQAFILILTISTGWLGKLCLVSFCGRQTKGVSDYLEHALLGNNRRTRGQAQVHEHISSFCFCHI